ncbi:hypothetical protein [Phorcysia thermohydrogeniphila]|uniref:Heavy-metal-binding protein n=1 Tax=Phorcysia thermohydrogeniphila TaxID=936138 RepID=A0A4R1G737_9BACT|nr:hypothetical protein [Phorcysia thermohydrogeniphila]TCK03318.1 hypothetical protein CLV27_1389 [Phorcysia thermohydrogeniphila]
MRFFLVLMLLLLQSLAFAADEEWYGFFTIDDLPQSFSISQSCFITRLGGMVATTITFRYPELNAPLDNCKECYLNSFDEVIEDCLNRLKKIALSGGFNAVFGVRVHVVSHLDTFQGAVVNGKLGYGYGYVRVEGTPVTIRCVPAKTGK